MTMPKEDVIDTLAGVVPGSRLDRVRALRPAARENAQRSFAALFEPAEAGDFELAERLAVATFVAGLHRLPDIQAFYASRLARHAGPDLGRAVAEEIAAGATSGPYGSYPEGPLRSEDRPGPQHRVAEAGRAALGTRLAAALEHAHLLVFRPRDASPEALQALLDAGFSMTAVVTLSQLVAFLTFQIRVIEGLRILGTAGEAA